jgi:hypothetical protein
MPLSREERCLALAEEPQAARVEAAPFRGGQKSSATETGFVFDAAPV